MLMTYGFYGGSDFLCYCLFLNKYINKCQDKIGYKVSNHVNFFSISERIIEHSKRTITIIV